MWYRRLLIVLASILAALFDVTISSWLPGSFGAIRVALPLVIVLAAFSSLERALTAAIVGGMIMDLFLPSFGAIMVRYVLIAFIIRGLAQTYVTNRSIIGSLALGIMGVITDRLLLLLAVAVRGLMPLPFIPEAHPPLFAEFFWIMIVMVLTFVLLAAFTRRFMPLVTNRR